MPKSRSLAALGMTIKNRLAPVFYCHFLISKSSAFLPFLVSAASQRGCLPRPLQVSLALAGLRYFAGTLPSLRPLFGETRFLAAAAGLALAAPPNSSAIE